MVARKAQNFSNEDQKLSLWCNALGHPARVAILRLLARHATLIGTELVEKLPLSQATVSRHLKKLVDVGLLKAETQGVRTYFSFEKKHFREFLEALQNLEKSVGRSGK